MIMSVIALILVASLCVNGDRQNAAQRYAQKPRGQMGFKWTRREYAQKPYGSNYGANYGSNYGSNYGQSYPQYQPYGKATTGGFGSAPPSNTDHPEISSTENTESASSSESFEEPEPTSNIENDEGYDDIDSTNTEEPIMNCVHDKCADAFNACFNDEQCKEWMMEWQDNKSLKPECMDASTLSQETENDQFDEATFETTASGDFDTTSNTAPASTESTESGYYYYYYDTTSSTSYASSTGSTENTENTENTYDEGYDTSDSDYNGSEEEEPECEYNDLFWDAYNCGVENSCYADQLKLAQSHQYIQSPSNYRVPANVTGSKSSSSNITILMVAISSAFGAVVMFEIARRLYQAFENKIQCRCHCQCVTLNNSLRSLKNKWEQFRGYKYEKTHHDLAAIEESDDAEIYGIESDNDEANTTKETTTGVTYNGPLNDDSDISDDVELQRTDDENTTIDDQFVHEKELTADNNINNNDNEEAKDIEEQDEITVEAVQEPMQEL